MQVFKTFMKVLKAKLPSACIYVIIFIIIGTIMAANSSKDSAFEQTKVSISIMDEDKTTASKSLSDYIGKDNKIVEIENDKDEILDQLYYQSVSYVLTIKEGYAEKIAKGETDDLFTNYKVPGNYTSQLVDSMIDEYVSTVTAYTTAGNSLDEAIEKAEKSFSQDIKVTKESFDATGANTYSKNVSYYFMYLPYIVISVIISAICPVLLVMNKKEIRNRTNCSSVPSTKQTMQLILGVSVFVMALWVILSAVMLTIYKPKFDTPVIMGLANSFVFLIISAGIALLVSQLISNENVVSMVANVIGLGMSFLCGIFVPQDMLGTGVLSVAKFLPAYWYVKTNNMLSGTSGEIYSASKYFEYVGIEFAFAVTLFVIVLLVSKLKRKS